MPGDVPILPATGTSVESAGGGNAECGCRPRRCAARRFARFMEAMAPAKIAGYVRTVAIAGIQGWEPSSDGAQMATAASVRVVTAVMLPAAIRLFVRLR